MFLSPNVILRATSRLVDPKPIYEALVGWLRKSGGWLAGEIWLKSAGLHHKKRGLSWFLRLLFVGSRCRWQVWQENCNKFTE